MPTTYTNLLYHFVFSTKDRRPLIVPEIRDELYSYLGGIIRARRGVLLEIGGVEDHVYILAKFHADVSVAEILRLIKANSSKALNERPRQPVRFAWQRGYGAFTVSESQVASVRQYIRDQETHHKKRTFQDEFVAMLKKHRIDFDERYLWD